MPQKISCILLCFILFSASSLAQQQGEAQGVSVKGQAVDSLTSETVPYATIGISRASSPAEVLKRLVCNEDGAFETNLAPGTYTITIQSVAKTTVRRTFEVAAGRQTVDLGRIMMTDVDSRIGEIVVTAQKPLVRMEIDKITYNLEDDPEAKTNTVLEALRKVPMITVDGEDKIQMKGSDNFKIYLNGKPTNMLSGTNASSVLKSMPASSVKNIEVITEPGAKYDAEGVGGIINIITQKNSSLQGYTATLNADATSLGGYRGGVYATTKTGPIGFTANYNYNHNRRPWTSYESLREQYTPFADTLTQNGRNRNYGNNNFGMFEFSYEMDTLNLLRIGVDLFGGKSTNRQELHAMAQNEDEEQSYSYDLNSTSENTYGATEAEVDFQHSTNKKDELWTLSYRFANEPNGSRNETYLDNADNYYNTSMYPRRSVNDAYTNEHTAQIDYTTPTLKDQNVETGIKYILRKSISNVSDHILSDNVWNPYVRPTDNFDHSQHIYAAYAAYSIKRSKLSYKAGARAEGTALKATYVKGPDMNFSADYFDIVPNATISYMLSMASQLRAGYNMRISRPGIWYLNPYVNNTDPQNISYGNPNLSSEKAHNFNVNYSMFTPKINLNANLTYNFINNSIESYTFVNPETGVKESTYENIGKTSHILLYLYGRWSPVRLFNISVNTGLNYTEMKSPSRQLSASGIMKLIFINAQFTLPKDITANAAMQYFDPMPGLQTKTDYYLFHFLSINKTLLDKKLTIGLTAQSPFAKYIRFRSTTTDPAFRSVTVNYNHAQELRLRLSYRFGTMKGSIKQVRRGISNDDAKSGGDSSGGGVTQE